MIPISTYRLQMRAAFPFAAAADLAPYLDKLGIGAAYLSPILLARPGSEHGYDICDHSRLNPELGGEEGFSALSAALRSRGLGCVIDFVPNHMGADPASNPWWWDVLENGPSSPYAAYFDIDWEPLKPDLKGKVLLPVLGDQYGRVLERGELRLRMEAGGLLLSYYEHRFPVNPRMAPLVLLPPEGVPLPFDEEGAEGREFLSILTALRNLPPYLETDAGSIKERQREKEIARKRMETLLAESPAIAAYVEERIAACNGRPGEPDSFDRLHDLLERQTYRLAFWRTAGHEINYRRFFDINGLMGIRMENPEALKATHQKLVSLFEAGDVTGVRLDHVDGLYDPAGYLRNLRDMLDQARPGAYVVVEKILTGSERLRSGWPVQGTTGYEGLNDINCLFVEGKGARRLERLYRIFSGWYGTFAEEIRECKRLILSTSMASELNVLANMLDRLSEADRKSRDFTLELLRDGLREVIAAFPIYRTYGNRAGFSEEDREAIDAALATAVRGNPAFEPSLFTFIRSMLLPAEAEEPAAPGASISADRRLEFALKFQQLTSPIHAKGVEDTAFYRRAPLLSLTEVGGEADSQGLAASRFHARVLARAADFPHGMIATSTHDTKRGEDARSRLNALADVPEAWRRLVETLAVLPSPASGAPSALRISRADEYLLYQTLVACWPLDPDGAPSHGDAALRDRVAEFMRKAAREAKLRTSWINPNDGYERALEAFLDNLLSGPASEGFRAAFMPFLRTCAAVGALRSLGQVALKCALPGVPDVYQGTERWDLSLVDPDNRRPVDFAGLQASLNRMEEWIDPAASPAGRREWALGLMRHWADGEIKQYVLARALRWRRAHPGLFLDGSYRPLPQPGGDASPWLAFAREDGHDTLIACVRLRGGWRADPLPEWIVEGGPQEGCVVLPGEWSGTRWVNLFTDTEFRADKVEQADQADGLVGIGEAALGGDFPVAWLHRTR